VVNGGERTAPSFRARFLKLAINPYLGTPYGQEAEFGFCLARDNPIAEPEFILPDARRHCRHCELNALVKHTESLR
jgi:hypothetical protein